MKNYNKKEEHLHFLKKNSSYYNIGSKSFGRLLIGITAVHKGAGATHLGLMLTTCISEGFGLKTAYLHCPDNKDIGFLYNFFHNLEGKPKGEAFSVANATFYPFVRNEMIAHILAKGYDCVIFDFGNDYSDYREEFLRCDKKIAVGSLAPWKKYYLEEFIKKAEKVTGSSDWIYAVSHTGSKTAAKGAKQLHKKLLVLPWKEDPFYLSPDALSITRSIIY